MSRYVVGFLGLALAVALFAGYGAEDILRTLAQAGWLLVPAIVYHIVPLVFDTLGWRALILEHKPALRDLTVARWIRESVNNVVPGQVAGDLVGVRLATHLGVRGSVAGTSIVGDLTISVASQLVFTLMGLALFISVAQDSASLSAVVVSVTTGVTLIGIGLSLFVVTQRRGMFEFMGKALSIVPAVQRRLPMEQVRTLDRNLRALYKKPKALITSFGWQLLGWIAGVVEIWLVLEAIGHGVSWTDAFILESLIQTVRSMAVMVPARLGLQEGGFVLLGAALGLDPTLALALALARRLRDVALGVPALLMWQLLEGRRRGIA